MPLNKFEVEINKAVISIELAKADFRKIPIQLDSVWKGFYNSGLRNLRSASIRLNKIITKDT